MTNTILSIVQYTDTEVITEAAQRGVTATNLVSLDENGMDEWEFEGTDAAMRNWYNEFYMGGSPESGNGYEFDVLGIG